jgi:hypothetical protein
MATPKLKKFPIAVPVKLHTDFKIMCAAKGQPMSAVIKGLLERELAAAKAKPAKAMQAAE